jgi:hypothetical protein
VLVLGALVVLGLLWRCIKRVGAREDVDLAWLWGGPDGGFGWLQVWA